MSYNPLSYNRINWKNRSESLTTPLGKTNLNKMDSMIYNIVLQLDAAFNELSAGKANLEDIDGMVKGVDYNSSTGVFTFTIFNKDSPKTVDLNIEKIPVNFSMDSNGVITMTTADGTKFTADIKKMIPIIKKADTDTIEMSIASNGLDRTISANIKRNSITGDYLQPNYLADITTQANLATAQANIATTQANNASYDANLARSYSIGDEDIREGSSTDNARYYKEQAEMIKNQTEYIETNVSSMALEINRKLNLTEFALDSNGNLIYTDNSGFSFNVDNNGYLNWQVVPID